MEGEDNKGKLLAVVDTSALLDFLSDGFCGRCKRLLESRLQNPEEIIERFKTVSLSNGDKSEDSAESSSPSLLVSTPERSANNPRPLWGGGPSLQRRLPPTPTTIPSSSVSSRPPPTMTMMTKASLDSIDDLMSSGPAMEQREQIRLTHVGRKKDFVLNERVDGRQVNVLKGIELHTGVFNVAEQQSIVDCVREFQRQGQQGRLKERTYTKPAKWMRGKGRETIQFGCCYNYAVDQNRNPPGIIRDEYVDPMPPAIKAMIMRLVRWSVLPPTCVPNSCIVNIYDEGNCIPPHIDHHDFVRPFCTVSFLAECNILFGSRLKVVAPGEFSGPFELPLPLGSVLILSGNGADVAKHCIPAVPKERISITFRKMDNSKLPYDYRPDPELEGLRPVLLRSPASSPLQVQQFRTPQTMNHSNRVAENGSEVEGEIRRNNGSNTLMDLSKEEFPPLGSLSNSSAEFPPLGSLSNSSAKPRKSRWN